MKLFVRPRPAPPSALALVPAFILALLLVLLPAPPAIAASEDAPAGPIAVVTQPETHGLAREAQVYRPEVVLTKS